MLTKMGWSEGKGLGVHEDGAMEQPQVEYKSDTRGIIDRRLTIYQ